MSERNLRRRQSMDMNALSDEETAQVRALLPKHQQKILYARYSDRVICKAGETRNVIVVITEHMIFAFKKNESGPIEKLFEIYIIEITRCHQKSLQLLELQVLDQVFTFEVGDSDYFLRILLRNYVCSSDIRGRSRQWKLEFADESSLQRTRVVLNWSQKFTFAYCAFSVRLGCAHYPDVSRYYHLTLANETFMFDANEMPIRGNVEGRLVWLKNMQMRGIACTLKFSCFTTLFSIENVEQPDIMAHMSMFINGSRAMKVLNCANVRATTGAKWLAFALKSYSEMGQQIPMSICFWDLSGNELNDVGEFMEQLVHVDAPVKGFRFERMSMDENAINKLFANLIGNEHLHGIQELALAGNKLTRKHNKWIKKWFELLQKNQRQELKMLSVGPMSEPIVVCECLALVRPQLLRLQLSDCELVDATVNELVKFVSRCHSLQYLDLSGSFMRNRNWRKMFKAIRVNSKITAIGLNLERTAMRNKKFMSFLAAMKEDSLCQRITELVLDDNAITVEEFEMLVAIIHSFTALRKFSIGKTFSSATKVQHLFESLIAMAPSLDTLCMSGEGTGGLGPSAVPLICRLSDNKKLKHLSMSHNRIGDLGLMTVANLLRVDKIIERIEIDGNALTDVTALDSFLAACSENVNLVDVGYPRVDVATVVSAENEMLIQRRIADVNDRLIANRKQKGIRSRLVFREDPVLNRIIEEDCVVRSNSTRLLRYGSVWRLASIWGIPLPFDPMKMPTDKGFAQMDSKFKIHCPNGDSVMDSGLVGDAFQSRSISQEFSSNESTEVENPPAPSAMDGDATPVVAALEPANQQKLSVMVPAELIGSDAPPIPPLIDSDDEFAPVIDQANQDVEEGTVVPIPKPVEMRSTPDDELTWTTADAPPPILSPRHRDSLLDESPRHRDSLLDESPEKGAYMLPRYAYPSVPDDLEFETEVDSTYIIRCFSDSDESYSDGELMKTLTRSRVPASIV